MINWVSPDFNGGTPITSFVISILDTVTSLTSQITLSPSLNSYLTTSLIPGRLYQINIKCVNNIGSSDWLLSPINVYPGVIPISPEPVTFPSVTRNSITLTWNNVVGQDTGGTNLQPISVTSYLVFMDNGFGGAFTQVGSTASNSFTMTLLKSGLPYNFKIQTQTIIGISQFNAPS